MGLQISDEKQKLATVFRHKTEQLSPKMTDGGAQTLQPPGQTPNNPLYPVPETLTLQN